MRVLPLLLALAVAAALGLAGCVSPAATISEDVSAAGALTADAAAPAYETFEWQGHVALSEMEGPSHVQPTEQALWPLWKEGFLFEIDEPPAAFEVALAWEGEGEFMIMLHSHKEHGSNEYVEHITPLDAQNPKSLRVPAEDLAAGVWQVMVHSEGARDTPFTLTMAVAGSAARIVEDERHGHWLQDGLFSVEEHEIEACQLLGEPGA